MNLSDTHILSLSSLSLSLSLIPTMLFLKIVQNRTKFCKMHVTVKVVIVIVKSFKVHGSKLVSCITNI